MDNSNLKPLSSNSLSLEHITYKESDPKKSSFTNDQTLRSKNSPNLFLNVYLKKMK